MLRKIPFETGINPQIMTVLKQSVEKMGTMNRKCILMFDEIAIASALYYDESLDVVEGFMNSGAGTKL